MNYGLKMLIIVGAIAHATVLAYPGEFIRPIATYSIVARDLETGHLGVAVQSNWFSVGSVVSWAEPGVGVVATQSFVEPSYGPLGLALMQAGKSAPEALNALLAADARENVRQVAMVDAMGKVAVHTGAKCIDFAGHVSGQGFSCQANLMLKSTVPAAMARAFQETPGDLADRMLAALEAAQAEGGDLRGKQSAAMLIVSGTRSGTPWNERIIDLRIEDHPAPLNELKRLLLLNRAYNHANSGDELMTMNDVAGAMLEYKAAMALVPENLEMMFWPAVTLAAIGRVQEALPLFKKVFDHDMNWAELVRRLPAAGLLPENPELLTTILAVAPGKH